MIRRFAVVASLLVSAVGLLAQEWGIPKDLTRPWAFPVNPANVAKDTPPAKDDGKPQPIPGSTRSFTRKQINDYFNTPEWFPNDHPKWPAVVQYGRKPVIACAFCHLGSGLGHPESANIAGLPAAYMIRQMAEFKRDARKHSEPMNIFAKNLTDQEVRESCEYFAALKPRVFYKVSEASMVPQTYLDSEYMRLPRPGGAMEPIGKRIITLPQDPERIEKLDPYAGFIAYVPPGSLKNGEALVKTGGAGKTVACDVCHGTDLRGLGEVPRIAGLHPIYIVRQLYKFQDGRNGGAWSPLMKRPVEKLTDDDIIAIAAYLGSLAP